MNEMGREASFAGFEALWGAIPYPALVVDADDAIVTANPATESFGATATAPCSTWSGRHVAMVSRWRNTT